MKILYLITQSQWGGAQKYVFDLACALNPKHEIRVVFGGQGELKSRLEREKIPCLSMPFLVREIGLRQDFLAFWHLYALLKKERADVIHTNSSKAGLLGNLAARLAGVPRIVYTAHGFVFNEPLSRLKKYLYIFLERVTARCAHTIICVSDYDRSRALFHKIAPPEKLVTIHNGIVLGPENTQPQNPKNGEKFVITAIANFYPNKGLPYLIEAAHLLSQKFSDLEFWVIGDGKERPILEKLISQHKLNNFSLLGFQDNPQKILPQSDLFVLPSLKEGFPYAIIEAMGAGLPIVASRVGGIPEAVIENENGLLARPADAANLAEKIALLKNNPALRKTMSEKNRVKVSQLFSFRQMLERTERLYG